MAPALVSNMRSKLTLCPGSRTISAATHLLSLQGDVSDMEVINVALAAPRTSIWYEVISQVTRQRLDATFGVEVAQ